MYCKDCKNSWLMAEEDEKSCFGFDSVRALRLAGGFLPLGAEGKEYLALPIRWVEERDGRCALVALYGHPMISVGN